MVKMVMKVMLMVIVTMVVVMVLTGKGMMEMVLTDSMYSWGN